MTLLFLAIPWLDISINILLVIHVVVCLLLALVVLMQRPKQEGLGAAFGSGLTDQAFGARTTDVLQKGTVYLGTLFFVITLVLAILIGKRQNANPKIVADKSAKQEKKQADSKKAVELPKKVTPKKKDAPVVMPNAKKPEVKKTEAVKPDTAKKPEVKKTEAVKPDAKKPESAGQPAPAKTPAEQPATGVNQ